MAKENYAKKVMAFLEKQ